MIGNTVAYPSKQLFISVSHNNCTKSKEKFPKEIAHVSFLESSAYIVLGQDDGLGKINFSGIFWKIKIKIKIFWNHRLRTIR